ncbi:DUF4097 family beta strand repeat-containing protein [Isoptericola aurantiacus]|uniref:DUF4097 family beta strand repeat-containing protein n=1 Tax=Isoptericola aurantiacus TaxID=3377839 RepID=UPI00383A0E7C
MPTFPTTHPVTVSVDVPFATVHVFAGERDDVVVTVLPSDPSRSGSVRAAEEVRVDHDGDTVAITYPGSWKQWVLPFASGTADITVELPTGSAVRGRAGSLTAEGVLGGVEMTLSAGDVRVEDVERLTLKVAAGSVVAGRIAGTGEIKVSAGSVRLGEVAGDAAVRAGAGPVSVGSVTGALDVHGAHGDVTVGRVRGAVTAKTAHGGIRADGVESGSVSVSTSFGSIEVGVAAGTAAYLDAGSEHGTVRNQLVSTGGPEQGERTAEVRARTGFGDVVVRRS